jgi:hypothetical protein
MTVSTFEQRILDDIAAHGWFCMSVSADSDRTPPFTYSVGFEDSLSCAEFIVFGLPSKLSYSMLWQVFRQIRDGGIAPAEGRRWSNILDGYDCISRAVHPSQIEREYFNSALLYRRHTSRSRDSAGAFQLFWPGVGDKRFPWESGCVQEVRDAQPLLYLPRALGLA